MASDDGEEGSPRKPGRSPGPPRANLPAATAEWVDHIRKLVRLTGLTQDSCARLMGVHPGTLSNWLRGNHVPIRTEPVRKLQRWIEVHNQKSLGEDEEDGLTLLRKALSEKHPFVEPFLITHLHELEARATYLTERIDAAQERIQELEMTLDDERARQHEDREKHSAEQAQSRSRIEELELKLRQYQADARAYQEERNQLFATMARLAAHVAGSEELGPIDRDPEAEDAPQLPEVWGLVPPRNPSFVGRESLLQELLFRLAEPGNPMAGARPEVLHGMAGVGKTQVVAEYVHRHASQYDLVWWIRAGHSADIRVSFAELAGKLGVSLGDITDDVQAVLDSLRRGAPYDRWILVFDDADDAGLIVPFLPTGRGHVVVTSRNSDWYGVGRPLEVAAFGRDESLALLRTRGPVFTADEANRIAEVLGDLPLALEQAAAWRATTGMPAAEYLKLFHDRAAELLDTLVPVGYEISVAAAWNISLDLLRQQNPAAHQLLMMCSFLAPEPLPSSLFTRGVGDVSPELDVIFGDQLMLGRAVQDILRRGLATIDHRARYLKLHRLLQVVLRFQMSEQTRSEMRRCAQLQLTRLDPGDPNDVDNWPRYAALLRHAIASDLVHCQDDAVGTLMDNLMRYLLEAGAYDLAAQFSESVLRARAERLGQEHCDTRTAQLNLESALNRVSRPAKDLPSSDQGSG